MNRFNRDQEGGDVQALLGTGFKWLTHCRYLLLGIDDVRRAAAWLDDLKTRGLIKCLNDVGTSDGSPEGRRGVSEAVQLAFSFQGLCRLGLDEHPDYPFPTAFAGAMASPERARLLGDRDRRAWRWGDIRLDAAQRDETEVHILVAHFHDAPFVDWDPGPLNPDRQRLAAHGLRVVQIVDTCPYYIGAGVEPFGFRDGLSQPRIAEFDSKPGDGPDVVSAGEFLLGHVNVYGEDAYCPDASGFKRFADNDETAFARNGTYLAVRQIRQDLARLRELEAELGRRAGRAKPTPVERMMGRHKDGRPILACPTEHATSDLNDFLFRLDDLEGFHCPRGSHIRRGNPRDALGWDHESGVFASKLHRLLRRGRAYRESAPCQRANAPCVEVAVQNDCGAGLFFVALNADLERQFEFVQSRWIASPTFADLAGESDPIIGETERPFSAAGYEPIGSRLPSLPELTRVIGGGYFFMPGLKALDYLILRATGSGGSDRRTLQGAEEWFAQPEVRNRPEPPAGTFEIALTLAGTVAAGAYTAGVIDFLIEALDQWDAERTSSACPAHRVQLRALAGSSGGGACAATLARAVAHRFAPQSLTSAADPPDEMSRNPLYRLWVLGFDLDGLCATPSDVEPRLRSLLHPGPDTDPFPRDLPRSDPRPWVNEPLTVLLALTNLMGVPYRFGTEGNSRLGQGFVRHEDYVRIEYYYHSSPSPDTAWPDAFRIELHSAAAMDPGQCVSAGVSFDGAWDFVRATSAFPVAFPAVELRRPAWHYLYQPIIVANSSSAGLSVDLKVVPPDWGARQQDPLGIWSLSAADGGALNDVPVELARRELSGFVGHDARAPTLARRAVILIDPRVDARTGQPRPVDSIAASATSTVSALLDHARFSTREIVLASDPGTRSRFLLTAVRNVDGRRAEGDLALAGGALGSFGGLLSLRYRHHDFMLGRRNCQRFLERHLTLAASNPSFGSSAVGEEEVPLIPLLGTARRQQPEPQWPAGQFDPASSDGDGRRARASLRRRTAYVLALVLPGLVARWTIALLLLLPRRLSAWLVSVAATRWAVSHIAQRLRAHGLGRQA
ncbi:MAG TPA: patatin-like phospholipase family protein [Burkholderiaceae bacterium]|nr:patatin-like phospholipase family protein [Burkholderiaceae bacterium]HQR68982.1 patatin-like phospholipase family protein [Burkholderiaceae bacterium]